MKFASIISIASLFVMSSYALASSAEPIGLDNLSRNSFTQPKNMKRSDYDDPKQIKRTWDRAFVWVPVSPNLSKRTTIKRLIADYDQGEKKFPTAIYLHGCAGLLPGASLRMKFLADNGFLVIGPASFARTKYPQSCDHTILKGGMFRDTLKIRKIDAGHAIEKAKSLSFVDADNMLLFGLSEGGITAATFEAKNKKQTVNARIVEGWTCTSGWFEYAGVSAPDNEPVLTLDGEKDPWYQKKWNKGNCEIYLNKNNGSKAIVYRKGKLAKRHKLLDFKQVQNEVLDFVKQHIDLP